MYRRQESGRLCVLWLSLHSAPVPRALPDAAENVTEDVGRGREPPAACEEVSSTSFLKRVPPAGCCVLGGTESVWLLQVCIHPTDFRKPAGDSEIIKRKRGFGSFPCWEWWFAGGEGGPCFLVFCVSLSCLGVWPYLWQFLCTFPCFSLFFFLLLMSLHV